MINVRKIQKDELLKANIISKTAFHGTAEDMEELAQDHVKDEGDQWAAFAEDGTMISRVINYRCEAFINGNIVFICKISGKICRIKFDGIIVIERLQCIHIFIIGFC